jgi:hypothetical protein
MIILIVDIFKLLVLIRTEITHLTIPRLYGRQIIHLRGQIIECHENFVDLHLIGFRFISVCDITANFYF